MSREKGISFPLKLPVMQQFFLAPRGGKMAEGQIGGEARMPLTAYARYPL